MTSAIQLNESILVDMGSRRIYLSKPDLTAEDEIASSFASVLEEFGIRYSIVAGYIAIMFGRSRRSDDIDFVAYGVGGEVLRAVQKAWRGWVRAYAGRYLF